MNPSNLPAMPVAHIKAWLGVLASLVVLLAVFTGVQLARGNSDIACSRTFTEEGACTNGSWGPWQVISQSSQGCTTVVQESRVYTGTREVVTGSYEYRTSVHAQCSVGWAIQGGTRYGSNIVGTITYQYAACQIRNDRTRSIVSHTGTCADTSEIEGILSEVSTETTGELQTTGATTTTGSYQDYLDYANAKLATSTIMAVPAFVRVGDRTDISWTANRVRSCTVVGSNGDSWTSEIQGQGTGGQETDGPGGGAGVNGNQQTTTGSISETRQSSPITQQTLYTLTCVRAAGDPLVSTATVNLIPVFQEQ